MANPREKGLTLQITKKNFDLILKGEQKVEHRLVWNTTMKQFVLGSTELLVDEETGEEYCDVEPRPYDYLYLINGRKKDAPRLKVEIVDIELYVAEPEKEDVEPFYTEDGKTYVVWEIAYHLGEVFETENIKE